MRKALNFVELSVLSVAPKDGKRVITPESVMSLTQKNTFRYDKKGDENYDVMSAFQKSMRGSDPNAALHYLARLLEAGDLPSATRRLMVCACEDVGLAYPMIIPIVKAAVDAALPGGTARGAHTSCRRGGARLHRPEIKFGIQWNKCCNGGRAKRKLRKNSANPSE